jgi:hypothetical protein
LQKLRSCSTLEAEPIFQQTLGTSVAALALAKLQKLEDTMIYEVRFQTVDPARRSEYVKMYKQASRENKPAAGGRSCAAKAIHQA